jgi:hypothetical protein
MIVGLIDGSVGRETAAAWAWTWVSEREEEVTDRRLWEPLDTLSGADSRTGPDGPFLYGREDFEAWLSALPSDEEGVTGEE